jgi:hypothetical protein
MREEQTTMKHRLVVAFILMVTLAALALPATAGAAGMAQHFRFSGKSADGLWTTCPTFPEPGVICTDTFIFAGERVFDDGGVPFEEATLFIDQFTYMFDDMGNFVFISERLGSGEATIAIDKRLLSATAIATVDTMLCLPDASGEVFCEEGDPVAVEANWTGAGDLTKVNGHFHQVSQGFKVNSHMKGTFREAGAVATVDGSDIGAALFARMSSTRQGDVVICHDCQ